jgi:RimJ/RimL family protein N-acetyltransferase
MHSSAHGLLKIPVFETERLMLRGHTVDDGPNEIALWTDPDVTRYIGGKPSTAEECWSRLLRYAGHWSLLGFGYWILEEKCTGDFVGEVGFSDYRRDIQPALGGVAEVGWALASSKHGLGYATEAVRAVLGWGREHFGPSLVTCLIDPDHHASIRVAQKCGFRKREIANYKGHSSLIFEREL